MNYIQEQRQYLRELNEQDTGTFYELVDEPGHAAFVIATIERPGLTDDDLCDVMNDLNVDLPGNIDKWEVAEHDGRYLTLIYDGLL